MSRSRTAESGPPPAKRAKVDAKGGYKFTSADEIRRSFRNSDQDNLTQALTALRNQLTVRPDETVSPQDERVLLAQNWMDMAPGAHDLFEAWEGSNQRQMSLSALFVSVAASLINLLSSHHIYHALGQPIVATLVSPQWMRRLISNIGGSHNELVLVTLKLLNAISSFAGGRDRKTLCETFPWETKTLPKLLVMRRKSKNDSDSDAIARPDIRTSYILFILSFIDTDTPSIAKQAFLEQHRDVFLSIFKGIAQDPYPLLRRVLEVCWIGVWSDAKIKRTLKIGFFNESTISQLVKLYDRVTTESAEAEHIPADLVHHFLLATCTRPSVGICFKDRGWYPRESDGDDRAAHADDGPSGPKTGKIYNKILSNVLKTLKVNDDMRQQELALKIMTACPELVAGYWAAAALTLEPRLSSKWIANISFFGSVISLPVPLVSFRLFGSDLLHPSPPPLANILENVFPSVNTKNNLSKGLQSSSALVQHCSALALSRCLSKYAEVIKAFEHVRSALDEDEEDGQWLKRQWEVEREVRRRVPEFQVIVGFSQQKTTEGAQIANPVKLALLGESAQRLLWMYHRCLPSLAAEARFDVGKLLHASSKQTVSESVEELPSDGDATVRLGVIRELHVLRLLKESDQFSWSAKAPSSQFSYLSIILKMFCKTEVQATRIAITSLLQVVLSDSILFQGDPEEVGLWLDSLPATRRAPGAESPEGAALTDEAEGVINFLDDCVQRCLKTPYRYLEERDSLAPSSARASDTGDQPPNPEHPATPCSPLLVVVLEQLGAKLSAKLLSPPDVLALSTFVRFLVFKLSSKQHDIEFISVVTDKFDFLLRADLFPEYPNVTNAIRREIPTLRFCIGHSHVSAVPPCDNPSTAVQDFLDRVEKVDIPESSVLRAQAAFELCDWIRLADHQLHATELKRLVSIINRLHPRAISVFFQYLGPHQGSVWDYALLSPEEVPGLPFDWLFVFATPTILQDAEKRSMLIAKLFSSSVSEFHVQRSIQLIAHSLSSCEGLPSLQKGLLLLAAGIYERAQSVLSSDDIARLKSFVFSGSHTFRSMCLSPSLDPSTQEGLQKIVNACLDPASDDDRKLASNFSHFWADALKLALNSQTNMPATSITHWLKYLESDVLFDLLDALSNSINGHPSPEIFQVLEAVMAALSRSTALHRRALEDHLGSLLSLRSHLVNSSILDTMIAQVIANSLPMAVTGYLPAADKTCLGTTTSLADTHWVHRNSVPLSDLDCSEFLLQEHWTDATSQVVSGLLYIQPKSRGVYRDWVAINGHKLSLHELVATMNAYLDSAIGQKDSLHDAERNMLLSQCSRILSTDVFSTLPSSAAAFSRCIYLTTIRLQTHPAKIVSLLRKYAENHAIELSSELLILGRKLSVLLGNQADEIVTSLVDRGLQAAVRLLSSGVDSTKSSGLLDEIAQLVESTKQIKPHLAEPVLFEVTLNHLPNAAALRLILGLVKRVAFKPASVNRFLQTVVQSPSFYKSSATSTTTRDPLVHLLHDLFHTHPVNTCQPSHLEPVVRIYGGTISKSDRQLLSIFQLFEAHRKTSVASLLSRWSSTSDVSSTPLEATLSLDPIRVLRTCLAFPTRISFSKGEHAAGRVCDSQIYDPIFVMLLVAQTLLVSPPTSALHWVQFFRTNAVSLLIRCLSAKDDSIRSAALCQIASLWRYLETADMQEQPHVVYILAQVKNTLPAPSSKVSTGRLPAYSTLILLHSLRGVFYPSNFIYPLTARFLLQRPELDTGDVPMLYNMLYNSTDDWKKERAWIIRFLADGMASTEDWRVFKRRHTWELLASLLQSAETDQPLRLGILDVLANITCIPQAVASLILKSSLLIWMEMQLRSAPPGERLAWVKILQNIVHVINPAKLEAAVGLEWRSALCRCLSLLVSEDSAMLAAIFPHAADVALRLSLLSGTTCRDLNPLITRLLQVLLSLEPKIEVPEAYPQPHHTLKSKGPVLHGSIGLHEPVGGEEDLLQVWGKGIESLWRASMTFTEKSAAWDALSSRLLLWRALVGEEESHMGEWARKEIVRAL